MSWMDSEYHNISLGILHLNLPVIQTLGWVSIKTKISSLKRKHGLKVIFNGILGSGTFRVSVFLWKTSLQFWKHFWRGTFSEKDRDTNLQNEFLCPPYVLKGLFDGRVYLFTSEQIWSPLKICSSLLFIRDRHTDHGNTLQTEKCKEIRDYQTKQMIKTHKMDVDREVLDLELCVNRRYSL